MNMGEMVIERVSGAQRGDGHRGSERGRQSVWWCGPGWGSGVGDLSCDACEDVAFDELLFASCGLAEGGSGEAVDLAQAGAGALVEEAEGVGSEELAIATGPSQPQADVVGGVVLGHGLDGETAMDPGVERAVFAQLEAVLQLGQ